MRKRNEAPPRMEWQVVIRRAPDPEAIREGRRLLQEWLARAWMQGGPG